MHCKGSFSWSGSPHISKSATFFTAEGFPRFSVIQEFKQNVSGSNPAKRSRKLYKPNRFQIISIKEANVKMRNRRPRPRPPVKTSYNGTSGSEEVKHHPDRHHCHHCHHYQVWESSMESIESSSAFTLKVKNTKNHKNQIQFDRYYNVANLDVPLNRNFVFVDCFLTILHHL